MSRKDKKQINYRHNFKRIHFLKYITIFIVLCAIYLTIDYLGPAEISLKNDIAFGFPCLRSKDLIVQEYDKNGNLWATRGMIIYKKRKNDNKFIRIVHIPSGFSIFWFRNFSIVRKLTRRPECVEMTVTNTGNICAMSAGKIWILDSETIKFEQTLKLPNYGIGDQGIRNDGMTSINDSTFIFGEYFRNPNLNKVRIFESKNNMTSWKIAFEFQSGQIRHIHSVQRDPYSDKLWVCTGDNNKESIIGYSEDSFKTFKTIGQGSQQWRVCQLVFTKEAVYWGTDTDSNDIAGIYRWDRNTFEIEKLQNLNEEVFFATRLAKGTIIMSTDCEGLATENNNKTKLYIISKNNKITPVICGTWNYKKPGFWYKYAMLRFQRNQDASSLAITILNQKEFPDGELIIINEETLLKTLESAN